ncbi:hypothetical protein BT93_F0987 [Corymbia citriodora subsp. variegata]|nr:hypothetical protein BT93_F0987 [Corymbia citriodora subsp. variegata]
MITAIYMPRMGLIIPVLLLLLLLLRCSHHSKRCLEGGADEFLLKPVQLSDLEKLQPYILKSLNSPCEDIKGDSIDDNEDEMIKMSNHKDDDTNKCNSNTNNVAKRKAMPAEPTDRRPKIKGLAVV